MRAISGLIILVGLLAAQGAAAAETCHGRRLLQGQDHHPRHRLGHRRRLRSQRPRACPLSRPLYPRQSGHHCPEQARGGLRHRRQLRLRGRAEGRHCDRRRPAHDPVSGPVRGRHRTLRRAENPMARQHHARARPDRRLAHGAAADLRRRHEDAHGGRRRRRSGRHRDFPARAQSHVRHAIQDRQRLPRPGADRAGDGARRGPGHRQLVVVGHPEGPSRLGARQEDQAVAADRSSRKAPTCRTCR